MNIKISKEEFDYIIKLECERHVIGSRLYGSNSEKSDTDILIIYKSFHGGSDLYYPNFHQFQYDDIENNVQYIFTSYEQFYRNMFSGDSTINVDVILFSSGGVSDMVYSDKLNMCRTYNIIKSYIGFAKRDLKMIKKGKNKLFHIERGLYCARKLISGELPMLCDFNNFGNMDIDDLRRLEVELRGECNFLLDSGGLTLFPKRYILGSFINSLEEKLVKSNNTMEFRY